MHKPKLGMIQARVYLIVNLAGFLLDVTDYPGRIKLLITEGKNRKEQVRI
jgi:hypothetical protein